MKTRNGKELIEQGARAFMMMTLPANVTFKNERDRNLWEKGYYRRKIKWIETTPLIPLIFRAVDPPRAKRVFRPRTERAA